MNPTTDATSFFSPLWRHKWLILAVGIIVAVGSYFYYKHQRPLYRATTQIYLGEEQTASAGSKVANASVSGQVAIINEIVVENVKQLLRKEHKAALVRGSLVKATAAEKSVFITLTTEVHSARGAVLLANATAQAYITRQHAAHQRSIEQAIAISRRQLHRIEAASVPKVLPKSGGANGKSSTPTSTASGTANVLQVASLNSKINQLESNLAGAGAQQIKPAKIGTAQLLSPTPKRNAIFGFVIGIVLASIAAYVLTRADRRLRSLAGVEAVLQSQLLVTLPKVRRAIVLREEGRPAPSRFMLEPLRRLHGALELGTVSERERRGSSRVILFTSANAGDGKSTLIADLALVQRDAGARVAVVEADFRRPVLTKLLGLDRAHGLADVLAGTLPVEDAMQRVLPTSAPGSDPVQVAGAVATAVESPTKGSLFLLAGGPAANPPALLADERMTDVLRSVAEDFDYVLIDAPSPLEVGDVMPLLNAVDGIVIVARLGHTREMSAQRLVQLLAHNQHGPLIGLVANCVPRRESERYGFASPNGRVLPGRMIGR